MVDIKGEISDSAAFHIKRNAQESFIGVDSDAIIKHWSDGISRILNYSKDEAIGKHISFILPENYIKKFEHLIVKAQENEPIKGVVVTCIDKHKNEIEVVLSVYPISIDLEVKGFYILMWKKGTSRHIDEFLGIEKEEVKKKRTFDELRVSILGCLLEGQQSTNQVANYAGINWKTVENHLTYLLGRALVKEVYKSEYVRIFDITDEGKEYLTKLSKESYKIVEGISR